MSDGCLQIRPAFLWFVLRHGAVTEPDGVSKAHHPRVTLIENFASHAAVQEFVDIKPD